MGGQVQAGNMGISASREHIIVGAMEMNTRYHPLGWLFAGIIACKVRTTRTFGAIATFELLIKTLIWSLEDLLDSYTRETGCIK
jgi:hypothetical protein